MIEPNRLLQNVFVKSWRPYLWTAVLVILAYGWSVDYGYTYFDDDSLILKSQHRLEDASNIEKAFDGNYNQGETLFYRPLLLTSFIMNYRISGIRPWGYHLFNLILHLAVCVLLFELLKRVGLSLNGALIGCLVFAVHPINTQAVAWIPGRNDTLLALFILPSAIFFIDYINKGGSLKYFSGLLFLAFGLLTKESAAVFPVIMSGYALAANRSGIKNRRLWILILGTVLMTAGWYWLRSVISGTGPEWQANRFLNPVEFLFMAVTFLGKVFLPLKLSPVAIPQWTGIFTGIAVLAGLVSLIFYRGIDKRPIFWFGLLWMTAFMLPYFARGSFVTLFLEHRFYLPLIGLLMSLSQLKTVKAAAKKNWFPVTISLLILFLGWRTVVYGKVFKNRMVFWEYAENTSPESSLVLYNVGLIHQENKQYDLAVEKYLKAIKINPDYAGVHNNLGIVYQITGKYDEAESEYQQAIRYNPHLAQAFDNLGGLYYLQGKYEQAGKAFLSAIKLSDLPSAHNNLGSLYYAQGLYDQAGEEFAKARRKDPYMVSAMVNLGSYYLKAGDFDKAETEYREALRLDPGNYDALFNLSLVYIGSEKYEKAEQVLLSGIKENPGDKNLYYQLSSVCFMDGKYDSSVKYYDRYLALGGEPDKEILLKLNPHRKDRK